PGAGATRNSRHTLSHSRRDRTGPRLHCCPVPPGPAGTGALDMSSTLDFARHIPLPEAPLTLRPARLAYAPRSASAPSVFDNVLCCDSPVDARGQQVVVERYRGLRPSAGHVHELG